MERIKGFEELAPQLQKVHRQPDGAGFVQNGAGDGLPDPPGGVGRKLVALFVVEAKHGPHEPQVAFRSEEHTSEPHRKIGRASCRERV